MLSPGGMIYRVMTASVAPMVYLLMFISAFIGGVFASGIDIGSDQSILWNIGVVVDRQIWGSVLLTTSTLALIGFARENDRLIGIGGLSGFMAWLFAAISYATNAHWYVFITVAMLHMMFHVYVYLANACGVLYRETRDD